MKKHCEKCAEIVRQDGEKQEKERTSQFKILVGIIIFIVILVLLGTTLGIILGG